MQWYIAVYCTISIGVRMRNLWIKGVRRGIRVRFLMRVLFVHFWLCSMPALHRKGAGEGARL